MNQDIKKPQPSDQKWNEREMKEQNPSKQRPDQEMDRDRDVR